MKQEINKENLLAYLKAWDTFDDMEIKEEGEAYKISLRYESKKLIIIFPYEVDEFFLDFELNGKPYFSDWYEIMDEPLSEFMSYTKKVAENYLFNEVRIKSVGWWFFKTNQLQYLHNGNWCNVF